MLLQYAVISCVAQTAVRDLYMKFSVTCQEADAQLKSTACRLVLTNSALAIHYMLSHRMARTMRALLVFACNSCRVYFTDLVPLLLPASPSVQHITISL